MGNWLSFELSWTEAAFVSFLLDYDVLQLGRGNSFTPSMSFEFNYFTLVLYPRLAYTCILFLNGIYSWVFFWGGFFLLGGGGLWVVMIVDE